MKQPPIFECIYIDYYSSTPKYLQLANSIIKCIGDGKINKNDILPSINELSYNFEISRDTAEKAYKYLKKIGLLGSVPGKGYYVKSTDLSHKLKVFLLFNKLSYHKKIIYDAIVSSLGDLATVDLYIFNNDFSLFKRLLQNKNDDYTHYVIIPHFIDGGEKAHEIINAIPKEKLILLDKIIDGIDGSFGAVYENFEHDLYHALELAIEPLSKYHTLKIIFPENSYYPTEILQGFNSFCQQYAFNPVVVHHIETEEIATGEAYINLMESDLVTLIEKVIASGLKVGTEVGVISYNETPLKKIILNGLTTISTDFQAMGEKTAHLIMNNLTDHIETPFHLTLRASL